MFPPVEITKNVLVATPLTRRLARMRHSTGVVADPTDGQRVLEELRAALAAPVAGREVLEIGPGRSLALSSAAVAAGARCASFDVVPYLTAAEAADLGIDHRVEQSGSLPWADESFDVVWSHSVLEHVRAPNGLLREVLRVLRPGGHQVALIDLETHLGGRGEPARMFEFLRFSDRTWELMTSHRSSWLNRLRLSDWRMLMRQAGFEVVMEAPVAARCGLAPLREIPYLAAYSDEDVVTRRVVFTCRRPHEGG